jgi:hypothetical protein
MNYHLTTLSDWEVVEVCWCITIWASNAQHVKKPLSMVPKDWKSESVWFKIHLCCIIIVSSTVSSRMDRAFCHRTWRISIRENRIYCNRQLWTDTIIGYTIVGLATSWREIWTHYYLSLSDCNRVTRSSIDPIGALVAGIKGVSFSHISFHEYFEGFSFASYSHVGVTDISQSRAIHKFAFLDSIRTKLVILWLITGIWDIVFEEVLQVVGDGLFRNWCVIGSRYRIWSARFQSYLFSKFTSIIDADLMLITI